MPCKPSTRTCPQFWMAHAGTTSATSTSSGIAIAVGDNDAAPQGEVIAVGPGRQTSMGGVAPMDVSKGDNVMFQSFAGSDVTLVGGKYKVVSASDCIAKW
eukprot:scaffold250052_cov30-Tisochrysis_lutea.AAC.2